MGTLISTAIMAHPSRERFIPALRERLGPVDVVWDEIGDRWDTGRRAMLAYDPAASHHMVIQDDAVLPRDLQQGVENALGHVDEGSPLVLYLGNTRPYRQKIQQLVDRAGNASFITMEELLWGVGVVVPTDQIDGMVAHCDRLKIKNYDLRMSSWFQYNGTRVWYSWPSLVDHRDVRDNPSLVHGRTANRQAHRFVGHHRSAVKVDWTGKVIHVEGL